MSPLRLAGVETFTKLNPDWTVRVHTTLPHVREALEGVECIEEHGLGFKHRYGMEADWTWWEVLNDEGGFQVATDIVFLRPIPDEWLEKPLNCCKNGTNRVYQFAALGCEANHPFMAACVEECRRLGDSAQPGSSMGYQSFGVDLLRGFKDRIGDHFDQPMSALCPIDSFSPHRYWSVGPIEDSRRMFAGSIGCHWYGGHKSSCEDHADLDSDYLICQLAREVLS